METEHRVQESGKGLVPFIRKIKFVDRGKIRGLQSVDYIGRGVVFLLTT